MYLVNMNGRNYLGGLDVDGMIILKYILRNRVWRHGLDSIGSG